MRKIKQVTTHLLLVTLFFSLSIQAKNEYQLPNLINNIDETSLSNPAYVTGQHWFRKLHGSKGLINYPPAYDYLRSLLSILLPVTGLHNKTIEIGLLNSEQSNAFVLPGNHLFLYSEIFTMIDSERKLLALLAHELAHLDLNHYERQLQNSNNEGSKALLLIGAGIAAALSGVDGDASSAIWLSGIANQQENTLSNSRQQEREADRQARQYLVQAGIDPSAMTELFLSFFQASLGRPSIEFLSTHPIADSRFADSIQGVKKNAITSKENSQFFDEFRATLLAYRTAMIDDENNLILSELQNSQQQNYALALIALLKKELATAQSYLPYLNEESSSHAYLKVNILLAAGEEKEAAQLIEKKLAVNPNNLMFINLKKDFMSADQFNYFDSSFLQYEKNLVIEIQIQAAKKNKNLPLILTYQALKDFSKGRSEKAIETIERAKKLSSPEDIKKIHVIDKWMSTILEAEEIYNIDAN